MQASSWREGSAERNHSNGLAVLDPTNAVAEVAEFSDARQHELLPIVYREWALANLDQAVEHAQNLNDEIKQKVIPSIVLSRADLPAEQRRQIARSFDQEWIAIKLLSQDSLQEPFSDPRQELEDILSRNPSTLASWSDEQTQLLSQVLVTWLTEEGIDALEEIEKFLPEGFLKERGPTFLIVLDVSNNNPELALQIAVATGSVGLGGSAWMTVRQWARSDPMAAFSAVSMLEGPSLQRMLQDQVFELWAANNPYELLDASRTMPQELQSIAQEKALSALAESSPQSASKLLGEIANRDALDRAANNIASTWARLDIDGALEWIANDEIVSDLQTSLYQSAIASVARLDPQLAMKSAVELPTDHEGVGPEGHMFRSLASRDLDLAILLLPQVRSGPTRQTAYGAVISNLLDDHTDSRKAMDLFVELSKEETIDGFNSALHSLLFDAPLQLFESLNELPTEDLKKRVAGDLLVHESDGLFSEEQLGLLREISGRSPRQPRSPELDAAFEELREAVLDTLE